MHLRKISKTRYVINGIFVDLRKSKLRTGANMRGYGILQAIEEYILIKNPKINSLRANERACAIFNRNVEILNAVDYSCCMIK